ncbi:hypothetical protein FD723_35360 (plasmid) [Nostoc sp. C052]|uniref:hypothetical protein n=1 Tax=Nostoc sp. C052 TaxID=2576902 RepID=UPI0015C3995E|nr:hypothetical protein [Nostoc sp. C052]QLE45558.1 hypothetical protein FD723_35360 [Nostoc sp. C052]
MQKPFSKRNKPTSTVSAGSEPPVSKTQQDISSQNNQDVVILDVPAVEIPELTEQEESDRLHLERRVERAFFEAGKALTELRDRRLYRSTHKTFEEYCRDRFGHSRRQSYLLMDAAVVFDNLLEKCDPLDHILPTNERQVRPMTKLEPEQQQEVWVKAVEQAGGKVPPARIVKNVVQQIMERTQVPNTYQIGEVCQILAKDNPELRGKGGCWAIVSVVNNFSCSMRMWDGEHRVGLQHLKSFNYLPQECEQMQVICDRINRVYSDSLEETVKSLLQSLGKLNRPYLTAVEEKLLNVLESEYGAEITP